MQPHRSDIQRSYPQSKKASRLSLEAFSYLRLFRKALMMSSSFQPGVFALNSMPIGFLSFLSKIFLTSMKELKILL
jgi:hypothetical protein